MAGRRGDPESDERVRDVRGEITPDTVFSRRMACRARITVQLYVKYDKIADQNSEFAY